MSDPGATPEIIRSDDPDPAERELILQELKRYNDTKTRPAGLRPLAVLLRDPQDGRTIGGLYGRTAYDWLYIDVLFVPEPLRRSGSAPGLCAKRSAWRWSAAATAPGSTPTA